MNESFGSEFFAGNRQRLRELFTGKAPIVITANGLLQQSGDSSFPFQQDGSFWYLTGIDEPDIIAVFDKDKEYLILPERSGVQEIFDGILRPDALSKASGIATVLNKKEGWKLLSSRLKKVKHIATLGALPNYIEVHGMYVNPARRRLIDRLKAANAEIELLDLRPHLARMRMVKQPLELIVMQTAIDVTAATLKSITNQKRLTKYAYEYEIEADITRGFRKRGATGHAFAPIVAGGERACTIHPQTNNSILSADELIVIDVGAEVNHYAADITRTICLNGKPSRRQEMVYQAVMEVRAFAFSLLRPGVLIRGYEQQVEEFMGEKLRELGLIKLIEHDVVRRYFPHATSHFLGIDPHDAGDYEWPLEVGTVLAVEPGIYIPEEALGVRIEDDVVITEDGIKILSRKLPADLV